MIRNYTKVEDLIFNRAVEKMDDDAGHIVYVHVAGLEIEIELVDVDATGRIGEYEIFEIELYQPATIGRITSA